MGVVQNSLCEQCHLIGFAPEYLFPGTLVQNRKIGPLRKLPGYSQTKTTSKVAAQVSLVDSDNEVGVATVTLWCLVCP